MAIEINPGIVGVWDLYLSQSIPLNPRPPYVQVFLALWVWLVLSRGLVISEANKAHKNERKGAKEVYSAPDGESSLARAISSVSPFCKKFVTASSLLFAGAIVVPW